MWLTETVGRCFKWAHVKKECMAVLLLKWGITMVYIPQSLLSAFDDVKSIVEIVEH